MNRKTIGLAMCGSFCTFARVLDAFSALDREQYDLVPIQSQAAYSTDTRFGAAADFRARLEALCGRPIIHTIEEAEPIGPKKLLDVLVIAPCTGNTLAKLAAGIADITFVGDADYVAKRAAELGLDLSAAQVVSVGDPAYLERYAEEFARLRAKKGVTIEQARAQVMDATYFGTMMVKMGDADGLVSGACHSTADTLRPALQILKTAPGTKLVSAFFVMCTDTPQFGTDGTLIFADCGLNINPSSDELSEIAIASAHSWSTFMGNVEPHVAMLSYSTMGSAGGEVAKKVQEAVKFCKEKAPELAIDGDLQLDAAIVPTVAQLKAPGSSVAGKANVLVFPDLEAGNIGYKLVQRFAGADAYGPILQGIAKPVNDLSRGCSADDIVGVVAITAVQAQMAE